MAAGHLILNMDSLMTLDEKRVKPFLHKPYRDKRERSRLYDQAAHPRKPGLAQEFHTKLVWQYMLIFYYLEILDYVAD
jgi:hypothetical protein